MSGDWTQWLDSKISRGGRAPDNTMHKRVRCLEQAMMPCCHRGQGIY